MEFYYDKEQVEAAGAVAFSKYDEGENSETYKKALPLLQNLRLVPEKKKDIVQKPAYMRELEKERIYIPCIFSPVFTNSNAGDYRLSREISDLEDKGDIGGIVSYITRQEHTYKCYMSPWEAEGYRGGGSGLPPRFPQYSDEKKRKIIQMYLTIAGLPRCEEMLTEELCKWAATALSTIGQVDEMVQTCISLLEVRKLKDEHNAQEKFWQALYPKVLKRMALRNSIESLLALKRLETKGYKEAVYALGIKYMYGCGCEKDYQEAQKYFTRGMAVPLVADACEKQMETAIKQGDFYVVFRAAMKKLETDRFQEGIADLERLAETYGFADALYELAKLAESGYRYQKDHKKALQYYTRAAHEGLKDAQRKMVQIMEGKLFGVSDRDFRLGCKAEKACWQARLDGLPEPPDIVLYQM